LDEREVKILSPARRRVGSIVSWHREDNFATAGRSDDDIVNADPRGHSLWVETESIEFAQRRGGEAVATDLVARKCRFVDDDNGATCTGEC
jgi:hypothetical protein